MTDQYHIQVSKTSYKALQSSFTKGLLYCKPFICTLTLSVLNSVPLCHWSTVRLRFYLPKYASASIMKVNAHNYINANQGI